MANFVIGTTASDPAKLSWWRRLFARRSSKVDLEQMPAAWRRDIGLEDQPAERQGGAWVDIRLERGG